MLNFIRKLTELNFGGIFFSLNEITVAFRVSRQNNTFPILPIKIAQKLHGDKITLVKTTQITTSVILLF